MPVHSPASRKPEDVSRYGYFRVTIRVSSKKTATDNLTPRRRAARQARSGAHAAAFAQTESARARNSLSLGRLIMCPWKSKALRIAACVVRKLCAEGRDLNPSTFRSRLRIGRCAFSACVLSPSRPRDEVRPGQVPARQSLGISGNP